MRTHSTPIAVCLVGCIAFQSACSSDSGVNGPDPNFQCISISGSGSTVGDRDKLMGDGTFRFNDEVRPAQVGIYFFEMFDAPNGGMNVSTQYQFVWPNGDGFLSRDDVFMEPTLEPEQFKFNVRMTIVSGTGLFAGMAGEQPIDLAATVEFGPPATPGDPKSATEVFTVAGQLCGL